MITIVLAEDHHVVREGLHTLLASEEGCRVVAEASDGVTAIKAVERLKPDVLLVDLIMPALGGIEVTREVTKRSPCTRVLILSMHSSIGYVVEAIQAGARGYLVKSCTAAELVRAVREVAGGKRYFSPPLSEEALDVYVRKTKDFSFDLYTTLSMRERQILHLVGEGYTNVEIGDRLFISPRTVETHRANLMRKLGLKNLAELIRYAVEREVLPPETRQALDAL